MTHIHYISKGSTPKPPKKRHSTKILHNVIKERQIHKKHNMTSLMPDIE